MPSAPRRSAALAALVVSVLALSACGSDDKKTTTTPPAATTATAATGSGGATTTPGGGAGAPLEKAALARAANAICRTTNAQGNRLTPPPENADNDHRSAFYGKLAALAAEQQRGLEGLTPAADVQAQYAAFLALTRQATDLVQGMAPAVKVDGGGKAGVIAKRIAALSPKINASADAFGARICGSDSSTS